MKTIRINKESGCVSAIHAGPGEAVRCRVFLSSLAFFLLAWTMLTMTALQVCARPSKRIPIEAAQREYQARYCFFNFGLVQWPDCDCTAAPPYPKDGFYGDLDDNPQLAVKLVADLISKFNTQGVYSHFRRSKDGRENIEGVRITELDAYEHAWQYQWDDGYVPNLDPATVNEKNYAAKFNTLFSFILKLRCVWVAGGKLHWSNGTGSLEYKDCVCDASNGYCGAHSCEEAQNSIVQDWPNVPWYPVTFQSIQVALYAWGESPPPGSGTAFFSIVPGRLQVPLTLPGYNWNCLGGYRASTIVYVQATNQIGGDSASHPAPVQPNSVLHPYASPPVGTDYVSDPLALYSPSWDDCTTYLPKGWVHEGHGAAVVINFPHAADPQNCGDCVDCISPAPKLHLASAHVQVGLGRNTAGKPAGSLLVHEMLGSARLYRTNGLHFIAGNGVTNSGTSGGFPQLIYTPQGVVKTEPTIDETSYTMSFYTSNGWSQGTWHRQITVAKYGGSTNQARITELVQGASPTVKGDFTYDPNLNQWQLISGTRKEIRTRSQSGPTRTETYLIYDTSVNPEKVVYREVETYNEFEWGDALVQKLVGPTTNTLTNTWTYGTNSTLTDYGRIKEYLGPYGEWERYMYDQDGRVVTNRSAWCDGGPTDDDAQCRTEIRLYSENAPHLTIIECVQNVEVARRYYVYGSNEVQEITCAIPGALYTDSANLKTITQRYPDELGLPSDGKIKSVQRPDGTMDFYLYDYDTLNRFRTTTCSGQPGSARTNILNGTKTVTVNSVDGQTVTSDSWAIVNGTDSIRLSSETNDDPDSSGRFRRTVDNLNGTQTSRVYGCCGVLSETDAEGVVTTYDYDLLGRRHLVSRNGITTLTTYDAAGNVLKITRQPSAGTSIHLLRAEYDEAGRRTRETNALNGVTTTLEALVSNKLRRTTTYPDLGTRIEDYFRDGRLQKVTGSAVFPVQTDYGKEQETGVWRQYVLETKLTLAGALTSEWTKRYSDALDRQYKTLYSDGAYIQSWFNSLGQLWKERDPDGVTTLYAYNGQGEQEYRIVALSSTATNLAQYSDLNNNLAALKGGTDRITQTVRTFEIVGSGKPDRTQTDTYVWADNNSSASKLVTRAESSADGLQTWQSVWQQAGNDATKAVSHSVTAYDPANHRRTVTATAPDGTQTVTLYQDGLLASLTRKDNTVSHNAVTTTSYAYDGHGRAIRITDSRTGTTTNYFNDADQLSGIVTPPPATGQNGQVTTNYFDGVGRVWKTTLPDSTSVTNRYDVTGLLTNTSGSRVYPVAYTYDYAGRMRTMKTWRNTADAGTAATTTWNYNPNRGWLDNKRYADNQGPSYTYTPGGRLKSRWWARGVGTTNSYNLAGELSAVSYTDGTPGVSYDYGRLGRRSSVSRAGQTATFGYNDAGLLLGESWSGAPLGGLMVTNLYDAYLRRATNGLWNGSAWLAQSRYGYDTASRLQSVTDLNNNSGNYTYIANSMLIDQIVFKQNGATRMTTTRQWDMLNRLTNIVSTAGSTVAGFYYRYNAANQRTNTALADGSYWVYTYDNLGQVTSGKKYWSDGTPIAGQQFEYAFDHIGNRSTAGSGGDQSGANLRYQGYTANSLNQYSSHTSPGYVQMLGSANSSATVTLWNGPSSYAQTYRRGDHYRGELPLNNGSGAVYTTITNLAVLRNGSSPDIITNAMCTVRLPAGSEAPGYDLDGNQTSDSFWVFTWDGENRLTRIESQTSAPAAFKRRLDFTYDYQGRRIEKIVSAHNGSVYVPQYTNRFVYDGWNLTAVLSSQGSAIQSFTWGSDLSGSLQGAGGVGGLLAVTDATSGTHFPAFDGNGNVGALVRATDGTVSAVYEYGPFGEVIRITGPIAKANPFRFSTKYQDDETDLLYYGYRYYNASTGRWINRDPIGESGGMNLYAFAGNDGLNRLDYLGCLVGSVKVLKNKPLASLFSYGWQIELEWTPPAEWNNPQNYCAPCHRAVWIQDRKYDIDYMWPWGPDIHTGWGVDWDETNFAGSAYDWIRGPGASGRNSWMHDEPEVGPSYRINDVFFMAVAKLKCIEGSDHGLVYAKVTWWYQKPVRIPLPGPGSVSIPIGGIISIE